MLILGDISGIQDFLFDLRDTGGEQAKTLRSRSLRIQLIVECIARRVLWLLNLPEPDRLLYCAAGKFAIDARGIAGANASLDTIRAGIEGWLMRHTHGRLKFTIIADDTSGTAAERYEAANVQLQRGKLHPWQMMLRDKQPLVIPERFDLNSENDHDVETGEKLRAARSIELVKTPDTGQGSIAGVSMGFSSNPPTPPQHGKSSIALERLLRHTPRHPNGKPIEFVELAKHSRGAALLGVLKADADSLGHAIRIRLGTSISFDPLRQFSQNLERFFGRALEREMSAGNSRWNSIYTIFSGGDDLLLVGPWDIIIDFAAHVRDRFSAEFKEEDLTISAGCAIVRPKFPIRLGARQAEQLLEQAKQHPAARATVAKDQFAVLDDIWKWKDHAKIIDAGKQLADWVDAGDIQRGWLHTVLELALLRRGQSPGRDARTIPEMATSRLSYHVARNWPGANHLGEKGRARQWIDAVLRHFDHFDRTSDLIAIHLPAIIRYAMLATRGKETE